MASTELGFLALPQFLKGTPELSILLSLPPLDPFAGVTRRRQGMGHLFPRRPPAWWCRGSGPRRRLVGGRLYFNKTLLQINLNLRTYYKRLPISN